jgi:hypothetical protein
MKKNKDRPIRIIFKVAIVALLAIVMLFKTYPVKAQANVPYEMLPHSTLYVSIPYFDKGLGIRYDYDWRIIGLYGGVTISNYWLNNDHTDYIKDHLKATIGTTLLLPEHQLDNLVRVGINIGLNYHQTGMTNTDWLQINEIIYKNWSFELGTTVKFNTFAISVRTDILRWEPCLDLGIQF